MNRRRRPLPPYLQTPLWYGDARDQLALPLAPAAYCVYQEQESTVVVVADSGEIFYDGPGPAVIVAPSSKV